MNVSVAGVAPTRAGSSDVIVTVASATGLNCSATVNVPAGPSSVTSTWVAESSNAWLSSSLTFTEMFRAGAPAPATETNVASSAVSLS